jgi:hypothetical protein
MHRKFYDAAVYTLGKYMPISVKNFENSQGDVESISAFAGISKAPGYIVNSKAKNLINSFSADYADHTKSGQRIRNAKRELRDAITDGTLTAEMRRDALKKGYVKDWGKFETAAQKTAKDRLIMRFKRLNEEQKDMVRKAATPEELKLFNTPNKSRSTTDINTSGNFGNFGNFGKF